MSTIRMEYGENSGGGLAFDFNDMVITVVDPNSGDLKLQSFPNSSVKHYFDSTDSLQAYYDEWTEYWKNIKNLFKQN